MGRIITGRLLMFVWFYGSRFHAFFCDLYRFDRAVCIEKHVVDTNDAMIGVGLAKGAPVIDDIIVIGAGDMYHGMMSCAGGNGHILLEDLADAFERACWRIRYGIGDGIVGA